MNNHILKHIGQKNIDEIIMEDIKDLLLKIWFEKTDTASKIRQRLECIMDYAKAVAIVLEKILLFGKEILDLFSPPLAK